MAHDEGPASATATMRQGPRAGVDQRPPVPGGALWFLLTAVAAAGTLLQMTRPIADPDLPWHVVAGREILDRARVTGLGADWSYADPDRSWTTTQWASEVAMTLVEQVAGLRGLVLLQLALSVLFLTLLARLVLRRQDPFWPALVFALVVFICAPSLQARPLLASLPLLAWLSGRAWHTLHGGADFGRLAAVGVTFAWANLHGLWVLVPAVLALLAACALLDRRFAAARSLAVTGGMSALAACLTPVGPGLLLAPVRFAGATARIAEWQPTVPRSLAAGTFDVLALLMVALWARSPARVPRSELLYGIALLGFALLAFRNLTPAAILLAPLLLHRLDTGLPRRSGTDGQRERRVLLAAGGAVLATGLVAASGKAASIPVLDPSLPRGLAERLDDGLPHRVLNDYNVGGTLVRWGGERTAVTVDGRADYYGRERIDRHLDLLALVPGWEEQLAELDPDTALLSRRTPLTSALLSDGWTTLAGDETYVLLRRPPDPP